MSTSDQKRVAISTGGGDCPGLNAVIQAAFRCATEQHGWKVFGVEDGLEGLIDLEYRSPYGNRWLTREMVANIRSRGGTIIGTSNKSNPFRYPVEGDDGEIEERDVSDRVIENFEKLGLDALISIGGDGSMDIAAKLMAKGLPVVGVPKTIDNDLACTDYTFGFDTAINIATEGLDRIHTTAASHDRVLIVEVMGRHAGFIALHAGVAGEADVILLPEIPYDIEKVVGRIQRRRDRGWVYDVIVVAEGAKPEGGDVATLGEREKGKAVRLGGAGHRLADELADRVEQEIRVVVLGHLQRGGSPTAFDRLLGARYGAAAMDLVAEGKFGRMVALDGLDIIDVPLEDAVGHAKRVDPKGQIVTQARRAGVCFGGPQD